MHLEIASGVSGFGYFASLAGKSERDQGKRTKLENGPIRNI